MKKDITYSLADPDFEGFDGVYVGGEKRLPPNVYKLSELARHLQDTHKNFSDFTDEEKKSFLIEQNL